MPGARRDTRGQRPDSRRGAPRGDRDRAPSTPPPGPPGAGGRTHRAPAADRAPRDDRGPRDDRPRDRSGPRGNDRGSRDRDRPQQRDRDRGPRVFEAPVPQDERSVELGALFKESQIGMRDARKALDKRKAEFGDEPDWMLTQLTEAEERFATAATAWSEHLETTGRKVVRERR